MTPCSVTPLHAVERTKKRRRKHNIREARNRECEMRTHYTTSKGKQRRREANRANRERTTTQLINPFSILTLVDREIRIRVIRERRLSVQEPPQPRNLGGEIHSDDANANIEVEFEDFGAGCECLFARCEEHVAVEGKVLDGVDELAEFVCPAQDAELFDRGKL